HHLESTLTQTYAALRTWHWDRDIQAPLHLPVLLLDSLTITGIDLFHCAQHALFGQVVVRLWRQRQRDLVPDKIRSWNLLEEARCGLKDNRVREHTHAPGRLTIAARATQFHQVQPDQANIDHVARPPGDLYAITSFHAVTANKEEISGYRQNYVLQGDG